MSRILGRTVLVVATILAVAGCYEIETEITLNPDGSGKARIDAVFPPAARATRGAKKVSDEQMIKSTIVDLIENSEGVEAWRDVSYEFNEAGRIRFRGTAYFKHISHFRLHNLGVVERSLLRDSNSDLLLRLTRREPEDQTDTEEIGQNTLSEIEITEKIESAKMEYQRGKPVLNAFLRDFRMTEIFHFGGRIKLVRNFTRDKRGSVRIGVTGKRLLQVLDTFAKDDSWWRKQILSGSDFANGRFADDLDFNEALFGKRAPITLVLCDWTGPLFDYGTEVRSAKNQSEKTLKGLGIAETKSDMRIASVPVEDSQDAILGNVRLVSMSVRYLDVRSNNDYLVITPLDRLEYNFTIAAELPSAVTSLTTGRVQKVITDSGEDWIALTEDEWDTTISFPRLYPDKRTVEFDVRIKLPKDDAYRIKELGGYIEVAMAGSSKEVDLGITKFETGAKGTEFQAVVESVEPYMWESGKEAIEIKLSLNRQEIKEIKFFNTSGQEIEMQRFAAGSVGNLTTLTYAVKGELPPTGRVVAEILDDVERQRIAFKLGNILLFGQPVE